MGMFYMCRHHGYEIYVMKWGDNAVCMDKGIDGEKIFLWLYHGGWCWEMLFEETNLCWGHDDDQMHPAHAVCFNDDACPMPNSHHAVMNRALIEGRQAGMIIYMNTLCTSI